MISCACRGVFQSSSKCPVVHNLYLHCTVKMSIEGCLEVPELSIEFQRCAEVSRGLWMYPDVTRGAKRCSEVSTSVLKCPETCV